MFYFIFWIIFINDWKIILHLHDFENLGDNIDYSDRFVTDREFDSINELHVWADEKAIGIDFNLHVLHINKKDVLELVCI